MLGQNSATTVEEDWFLLGVQAGRLEGLCSQWSATVNQEGAAMSNGVSVDLFRGFAPTTFLFQVSFGTGWVAVPVFVLTPSRAVLSLADKEAAGWDL